MRKAIKDWNVKNSRRRGYGKNCYKKEEGFYVKDVSGVVKDLLGLYEKEVLAKLTESFSVTEKAVASMEKLINDEDKLKKM